MRCGSRPEPSAERGSSRQAVHYAVPMAVGEEQEESLPPELAQPPDHAPLAAQTLAYGLSGFLGPLVGMITLPIFARTFTQSQYGILELATTATSVALAITDAGLTAAALRGFYDYRADQEPERREVMTTGFAATTLLALVVAAVMVVLRTDLSRLLFGNRHEQTVVILVAVGIPALNTWRYVTG